MALAAVLGPNQNTLVVATPVFVLQLPALVERVVVGPQREPRTLLRAAQKQRKGAKWKLYAAPLDYQHDPDDSWSDSGLKLVPNVPFKNIISML